ncbi:MAG: hypothetical protein WA364_30705 [Candidatus Nitrosopolaris sp.]
MSAIIGPAATSTITAAMAMKLRATVVFISIIFTGDMSINEICTHITNNCSIRVQVSTALQR